MCVRRIILFVLWVLPSLALMTACPRSSGQGFPFGPNQSATPLPAAQRTSPQSAYTIGMDPYGAVSESPSAIESLPSLAAEILTKEPVKNSFQYRFGGGVIYDNNIFLRPKNPTSDVINVVSGGASLSLGNSVGNAFLSATYSGSGLFYQKHSEESGTNQSLSLVGGYAWPKTRLVLSTNLQYSTGPDIQIGGFADRFVLPVTIALTHEYSEKFQFGASLDTAVTIYQKQQNSEDTSATAFIDYRITGKTSLGLGLQLGLSEQEGSSLQTYQTLLFRLGYSATEKVDIFMSTGPQLRQYGERGGSATINYVFSLGGSWTPRQNTSFTLSAFRNFNASASQTGVSYYATGFNLTVQQRLFSRFNLGVALGLEADEYQATEGGISPQANQLYTYVRPTLAFPVTRYTALTLFFEHRESDSERTTDSWTNQRIGVEGSLTF